MSNLKVGRIAQLTHTPAPWKWFNYPDGRKLLAAAPHAVIHCPDAQFAIDPADANLIAAAPDLLAALKEVTFRLASVCAANGDFSDANAKALDDASVAMQKALGEP